MGPLIFIARTHQIKRKKSQLNLRLMQIQSRRQDLAQQISNAQQHKTANQNMWNMMNNMQQRQMEMNSMMMLYGGQSLFGNIQQAILSNAKQNGVNSGAALGAAQGFGQFGDLTNFLNYQNL